MWSCVLQALGSRAVYQGESYIILLVNALHVHFYSSAWQYLLYFVADSNRNRPCAGGLSMDNSEPSVAVPLLLPGHQSVVVWELYPCRYSMGVSDAELTDKTAPLPVTAGNNGACDQMTARHAGHKELFSPLFFLNTWPRIWSVFLSLCCCPDVLLLFSPHSKVLQCQARHPHSCCNSVLVHTQQLLSLQNWRVQKVRHKSKYRISVSQVLCPYPVVPIMPPACLACMGSGTGSNCSTTTSRFLYVQHLSGGGLRFLCTWLMERSPVPNRQDCAQLGVNAFDQCSCCCELEMASLAKS